VIGIPDTGELPLNVVLVRLAISTALHHGAVTSGKPPHSLNHALRAPSQCSLTGCRLR
jgi:hypothetical protein